MFLFEKPYISSLLFPVIYLIPSLLGFFVVKTFGNEVMLAWFLIISFTLYFSSLILISMITPRYQFIYEDLMQDSFRLIRQKILPHDRNISSNKENIYIRKKIKKSVDHYRRKGLLVRFFLVIDFTFVMNCLASKDFQKALFDSSNISIIWSENPLGFIALVLMPLIAPYYLFRYETPQKWMKDILDYIEIEFEDD
ncbi:hypothetical protein [Acaryochloris sp. CCMEE 5410]|uniref:hypothetical protein n=1 Tax=Acaryochloris sp. CCMEE 5410 TaxID=310037 RepID=UPI0011126A53|nr:hypothetical protein [Acaryochloris sp. CCMEE 5410]